MGLPEAWLQRLTRPERLLYEFLRQMFADRSYGVDFIMPTYDDFESVVSRRQVKRALGGLQQLGLLAQSGVVR